MGEEPPALTTLVLTQVRVGVVGARGRLCWRVVGKVEAAARPTGGAVVLGGGLAEDEGAAEWVGK